jgi:3-dehydroquinate synthetase
MVQRLVLNEAMVLPLSFLPQGWVDPSILVRTRQLLQRAGLPVEPPSTMTVDMFKQLMSVDKKVRTLRGGDATGL